MKTFANDVELKHSCALTDLVFGTLGNHDPKDQINPG